jgi:hypothetical protein
MATLYLSPIGLLLQQLSNLGVPLQGGFVNVLVAGSVSTPQASYTDSTGGTLNAQPIVLNAAGRMASVSGAPVSVWVPANTPHKMTLTDSAGNLLSGGTSMDNLLGIGDPTAVNLQFSNPATGFGADLVANTVRSYDVVASVRAANVPTLGAGQTLVINVEGGSLVNDGNGGLFYWSASSTATDDAGATTIKPTAILVGNPGRYLRQNNLFGTTTGTFTMTVTGCTTAPAITFRYTKQGGPGAGSVILSWDTTGALTSNSTGFGFSGFPNGLTGNTKQGQSALLAAWDNSVTGVSCYMTIPTVIGGSSVILSINNASGAWTNTGTKQLLAGCMSYTTF